MGRQLKRVNSAAVQGDGSFVVMKPLGYGASKSARERRSESDDENMRIGEDVIALHVVEWNWTDWDGTLLPLPSVDRTVIDRLTVDEVTFLGEALQGNPNASSG